MDDEKRFAVEHDPFDVVVVSENDLRKPDTVPLLISEQVEVLVDFQILHFEPGIEPLQFKSYLALPKAFQLFYLQYIVNLGSDVH